MFVYKEEEVKVKRSREGRERAVGRRMTSEGVSYLDKEFGDVETGLWTDLEEALEAVHL